MLFVLAGETCPGSQAVVHTTVYVGSHFEVRDHDQPTKYVFNGPTRVASVIGSLSSNSRVQRLRLYAGWNLVSLAVSVNDLAGQLGRSGPTVVSAVYRWAPGTEAYVSVTPGQSVEAGAVIWVKAEADLAIGIVGSYAEPVEPQVPAGGSYLPGTGLEAWTPLLSSNSSGWFYDAQTKQWHQQLPEPLEPLSDPPWTLAPGQAMYINADAPSTLTIPDSALRIRYYHQDHLGSSRVITDANGALVEESAFYPFGQPRNLFRPRSVSEPYLFTQKESDSETGLQYFGKRYYLASLAKWLSTDPLEEKGGDLNLYAYGHQNPLKYIDPTGADIEVQKNVAKGQTTYSITVKAVLVNLSDHQFTKQELNDYAQALKATVEKSYSSDPQSKGKTQWHTSITIDVEQDPSKLSKSDSRNVLKIVNKTSHLSAGQAYVGGKSAEISVDTLLAARPGRDFIDPNNPLNAHYVEWYQSPESVGAHELGHLLGLEHFDGNNLMQGGVRHNDKEHLGITQGQIEQIYNNRDKLNQDDEALERQGKRAQ